MFESIKQFIFRKKTFIEKMYLYAYAFIPVIFFVYKFAEESTFTVFLIFGVLFFNFAFLNDIVEKTKFLLEYPAIKLFVWILLSIATTFIMIQTYQDVNNIIGIDPSELAFATSVTFLINAITITMFYINILFLFFILFSSVILPLIFMFLSTAKELTKNKNNKTRNWFIIMSRTIAIFTFIITGSAISPYRINTKFMKNYTIYNIAINADFNSNHFCNNSNLINKPVLFLQKGYVLYPENNNSFKIEKCY